jgi:hypothetical protein
MARFSKTKDAGSGVGGISDTVPLTDGSSAGEMVYRRGKPAYLGDPVPFRVEIPPAELGIIIGCGDGDKPVGQVPDIITEGEANVPVKGSPRRLEVISLTDQNSIFRQLRRPDPTNGNIGYRIPVAIESPGALIDFQQVGIITTP